MKIDYSFINSIIDNFNDDLKLQGFYDDISVYVFPQSWGSTALGYDGIGGSQMTTASTIVLYAFDSDIIRVYFGCSILAYEIKNPNKLFFDDLHNHRLEGQFKRSKYFKK